MIELNLHHIAIMAAGYFISNFSYVMSRQVESRKSPKKFDLWFFLKDTAYKLVLSFVLTVGAYLSAVVLGEPLTDLKLLTIGAAPDFLLNALRFKFGLTKPDIVRLKNAIFHRK